MNITITGNLGSGKSTVCKLLKKKGFEIISAGTIFRDIAKEKNITVEELNELAKTDRSFDDLVDNRTIALGKEKDGVIFDSRLAWHFIPDSFKIFLLIKPDVAAERVYNGSPRDAENYHSIEEVKEGLKNRTKLELHRYNELYGVNYLNASNYNLVIESTYATPDEIANEIIRNYELYKTGKFKQKIELNTRGMYPTQRIRDINENIFLEYIQKEKENQNLCAIESVPIIISNGKNYLADGHHRV